MRTTFRLFRCRASRGFRGGFTLVEAALTTMIVGMGTVAMLTLLASGTKANQTAAQLTTAVNLANNIHELADRVAFPPTTLVTWGMPVGNSISAVLTNSSADLSWLNGQTFNPPVDATDTAISGMSGWSQVVSVSSVSSTSMNNIVTNSASNPMARVSVTVDYNGNPVFTTSWVVAR